MTVSEGNPYDVAIIGSGFAGTILARVLRQQGRSVLVLEKGQHPRFALGESTTPLANFALERLARRSGLEDLFQLATYGRWRRHLPHLHRGLKRGFTFYRHQAGAPFSNGEHNEHRLLVAASPEDDLADSHWLRSDVDHHLLRRAIAEGVDVHQDTHVDAVEPNPDHLLLRASQSDRTRTFQARYVVDGSGPAAVLPRSLGLSPVPQDDLPQATLVYTHADVARSFPEVADPDNRWTPGPYPDEQAAVHHLLDEGWIYVLPFDKDESHRLLSLGALLYGSARQGPVDGSPEALWKQTLADYPSLAESFADLSLQRPWERIDALAYRQTQAVGERWFLLPHTFAFVDPMFSTGMAWSLLAVERLSDLLGGSTEKEPVDGTAYGRLIEREADQITRLIVAARLAQHDFELFKHITFLYFATVSYAELRQRLLDPAPGDPAPCREGFLGATDPRLVQLFEETERLAEASPQDLLRRLQQDLAPYDAIGLFAPHRRNLYPVDLDILLDRSHLLGMSREQMTAALPRLRGETDPFHAL